MLLDQSRFPLVFIQADTPSELSEDAQMEALLGRAAPFVLIAPAQAKHDHGDETPDERKQRALQFKSWRERLRRLCRGVIVVQGGKPLAAPFRLAAEGFGKAVGVTVRFVDDEAAAVVTATAMLEPGP